MFVDFGNVDSGYSSSDEFGGVEEFGNSSTDDDFWPCTRAPLWVLEFRTLLNTLLPAAKTSAPRWAPM